MNDQTSKALEILAAKLGTTAQYLWGVLLHQAPISAAISLFQYVTVALAAYALYRIHIRFTKQNPKADSSYTESIYDEYEAAAGIPVFIAGVTLLILAAACVVDLSNCVNGFFDPEYWALQQLLSVNK